MGLYRDRVLPRLLSVACGGQATRELRRRVCTGLHGEVIEIGFGSGLNVPFYPRDVTGVAAVEPAGVAWQIARKRVSTSPTPVYRAGLDGQTLQLPDNLFDSAISSWTLCTIPDARAALLELRRVLKPGADLHFIEHGLAPDESVQRWQRRLEPLQKRCVGGCHLTRRIPDLVIAGGFMLQEVDEFYEKGAPKPLAAESLGIALSTKTESDDS